MCLLFCDGNKNAYSLQSSACNTMHGMAWFNKQVQYVERAHIRLNPPVPQVASRKRAYKLNSTDMLHAYLLRLAADMHQAAHVACAAPVEGNRHAGLSLWKCLLAAAAVAVAHQVRAQLTATFKVASASAARQSTVTVHMISGNTRLAHRCSSISYSQVLS